MQDIGLVRQQIQFFWGGGGSYFFVYTKIFALGCGALQRNHSAYHSFSS